MDHAYLDRRLLQHVRASRLFPEPGTALLAVSGGPDSLALLDLFHALAPEIALELVVAHVDHGILPDSARVADQVAAIGAGYHLPVHVERAALGPGTSETRARRARYAALRGVQHRVGARYLVTAHQADDQLETILYRLLRGSGLGGLAGIQALGPRGLVRPLLPFRRRELEQWLAQRFPDPVSRPPVHLDPSNADLRHDRVWIRSRVLPSLRERLGQRLDRALLDLAAHAGREREAWTALLRAFPDLEFRAVDPGVEVALPPLLAAEPSLAEALLRALAREAGCLLGPKRSARLLGFVRGASSGRSAELGEGFLAEVSFGRLRLSRVVDDDRPGPAEWGKGREGRLEWGDWEFLWGPEKAGISRRSGWAIWVEPGCGVVRAAAVGDRLVPLGGSGHRAVSRLLMEARVARGVRRRYPVVLRGDELVWVPGVCRAQAAVPDPGA
ncbi:MAG: tRNA lysidine(34) synthetase TilS, partial [Gemmatimonadetes bacterium]|nr:tRNA lysidine(34) synthetase TilS [Gemmatimonadota bacterium]